MKCTQCYNIHKQMYHSAVCPKEVINVYAHILDEDRKINAQKFETAFYGTRDLRDVKPPQEPAKEPQQNIDLASLIEQL